MKLLKICWFCRYGCNAEFMMEVFEIRFNEADVTVGHCHICKVIV